MTTSLHELGPKDLVKRRALCAEPDKPANCRSTVTGASQGLETLLHLRQRPVVRHGAAALFYDQAIRVLLPGELRTNGDGGLIESGAEVSIR